MEALVHIALFVLGAALIIKGSDWFLDAAVWFARVFRIPEIVVGATIVSICTTVPEMVVSMTAAARGETDMAVGNALGSIVSNSAFILGVLLFFSSVTVDNRKAFRQNGLFLLLVLGVTLAAGLTVGEINLWFGIGLIVILVLYILENVRTARQHMTGDVLTDETTEMTEDNLKQEPVVTRAVVLRQTVLFLIGIGMVVVGADMLVGNGVSLAELLGVPTLLISLIFTSLGTSLPELVTTITSIRKKATNMGIGNLIGANVMNIAQVLGAASLFRALPLTDSRSLMLFQLPFTLLLSVLILGFGLLQKKTRRWNGAVLIGLYVVFLVLNLMRTDFPVLGPFLFGTA